MKIEQIDISRAKDTLLKYPALDYVTNEWPIKGEDEAQDIVEEIDFFLAGQCISWYTTGDFIDPPQDFDPTPDPDFDLEPDFDPNNKTIETVKTKGTTEAKPDFDLDPDSNLEPDFEPNNGIKEAIETKGIKLDYDLDSDFDLDPDFNLDNGTIGTIDTKGIIEFGPYYDLDSDFNLELGFDLDNGTVETPDTIDNDFFWNLFIPSHDNGTSNLEVKTMPLGSSR